MNTPLYIIKRTFETQSGTAGVLAKSGKFPMVVTLEPPWLDNKQGESCIPANVTLLTNGSILRQRPDYLAILAPRADGEMQWLLQDVENRSRIFIHPLNWLVDPSGERQTAGCIGVGESFSLLGGIPSISDSMLGFGEFMKSTAKYKEISIRIIDCTRIV